MFLSVAAASGQVFIVEFVVFRCRFFFYHETLSKLLTNYIKAFALVLRVFALREFMASDS